MDLPAHEDRGLLDELGRAGRAVLGHGSIYRGILGEPEDVLEAQQPGNGWMLSELRLEPFSQDRSLRWGLRFALRLARPGLLWRRRLEVIPPCTRRWSSTQCANPAEQWFFINGVTTDDQVADDNVKRLERLFGRPVTLLYNPTDGLVPDLYESVRGRIWDDPSAPTRKYAPVIERALLERDRVVLLSHSQGGIISANIVRQLIADGLSQTELERLELYMFASATDEIPEAGEGSGIPFVEHYFNEHDLVARFGPGSDEIELRGDKLMRAHQWGHLLNHHYLDRLGDADAP